MNLLLKTWSGAGDAVDLKVCASTEISGLNLAKTDGLIEEKSLLRLNFDLSVNSSNFACRNFFLSSFLIFSSFRVRGMDPNLL